MSQARSAIDLEEGQFIDLGALSGAASAKLVNLLKYYLARDTVSPDGLHVRCLPVREARSYFSAKNVRNGARLFSPQRGPDANVPMVMMQLEDLLELLSKAQDSSDSLVRALAPSAELPAAPALTISGGDYSEGLRFLIDDE